MEATNATKADIVKMICANHLALNTPERVQRELDYHDVSPEEFADHLDEARRDAWHPNSQWWKDEEFIESLLSCGVRIGIRYEGCCS